MTKPNIKPTKRSDIPALQEVLNRTGLFPGEMLPDVLAPFLADATAALWFTCHIDDKAVGFCYAVPEELADGTWNMLALAVHPDQQGRGLGSALVAATEQHLNANRRRILIIDTSGTDAFAKTRRFYAQNGYEEEARIRDFWADGDDKIIFRKALRQ